MKRAHAAPNISRELTATAAAMTPPTIVVMGDGGAGKTALLRAAGLVHGVDSGPPLPLECAAPPEIANTDAEILEISEGTSVGAADRAALMRMSLRVRTLDRTVVVIVIDLSRPSAALERLDHWVEELRTTLDGVHASMDAADVAALRAARADEWASASARLRWLDQTDDDADAADGAAEPPRGELPRGVLELNLGMRLIVVANKLDELRALRAPPAHVAALRLALRRACVRVGAPVIFTSAAAATGGPAPGAGGVSAELVGVLLRRLVPDWSADESAEAPADSDAISGHDERAELADADEIGRDHAPLGHDTSERLDTLDGGAEIDPKPLFAATSRARPDAVRPDADAAVVAARPELSAELEHGEAADQAFLRRMQIELGFGASAKVPTAPTPAATPAAGAPPKRALAAEGGVKKEPNQEELTAFFKNIAAGGPKAKPKR